MLNRIKGPLMVLAGGCLVIAGSISAQHYLSLRSVQVTNKTSRILSIYKTTKLSDGGYVRDQEAATAPLQPSEMRSIKFSDGSYVAVMPDQENKYANKNISFSVRSGGSIELDSDYSNAFLSSQLTNEKPAIMNAINSKLSAWPKTYDISTMKLYRHGEWAGIVFAAKNPQQFDDLRTILEKKGNVWELVVSPPQIIVGKPSHRDIPPSVIDSINISR